jgi:signal transduction histidine kinase
VAIGELARRVCRARGVDERTVAVDGPDTWLGDGRRIEQLVTNLVDNAQAYGGGVVAIRCRLDGSDATIEVDDEGPGVSPDDRAAIFNRFVRGRAAHARANSNGTGLGLALVAQHAAAHGGTATVTDRPGGGARFRIELRECRP